MNQTMPKPDPLEPRRARIRRLNDQFRRTMQGGEVVVTAGIAALGPVAVAELLLQVQQFEEFLEDCDPFGEHDFGSLQFRGQRVFWKIDYYDLTMTGRSPDPADPAVTTRVLTIMLATEY